MLTITHVIPDSWGPFVDIRACWLSCAERRSRVSVITPEQFPLACRTADPDDLFICWTLVDPGPIIKRDCYVAAVYSEALDEDGTKMLPEHHAHFRNFLAIVDKFDAVFAHTPRMAELIGQIPGVAAHVMPVGWDLAAMGIPRWEAPRHTLIGYRGSPLGRRLEIIPMLHDAYRAGEFSDMIGQFGRSLFGRLDQTSADLYVAHSLVESFSTWRLWQVASTSATLVAEPGDTWPFVSGEHYIEIPRFTMDNFRANAVEILGHAKRYVRASPYARGAHELAREYSVDAIVEKFILPAFEEMRD